MGVYLSEPEFEDNTYDACGNTTYKVLKINYGAIRICLCEQCFKQLCESIELFMDKVEDDLK